MIANKTAGSNQLFSALYVLAEILHLLHDIGVFFLIDYILNGDFFYLGLNYYLHYPDTSNKEAQTIISSFPLVTKCQMNMMGVGGDINVR